MAWHPFRHFGLKLAALGLGILLWITVSGQTAERRVRVPLEFRQVPASLEIVGDAPDTVEVRIRGTSSQISRLEIGDIVAVLDLGEARSGVHIFPLRTDQIVAPFGVEVLRVDPAEVTLGLEASGKVTVPIVPVVEGQPAPGFVKGKVTVEPATVEVLGPESRLKDLKTALTERISIEGAKADVTVTVAIGVGDAALRLRDQHTTARVRVAITVR